MAVRCMHESQMHDDSAFITLTYKDLPGPCPVCSPEKSGSICICTCQLFLKRLRERVQPKELCRSRRVIRFLLCGEYGEKFARPHYHALIFGWFPHDAVGIRGKPNLYSSEFLDDVWGHGGTRTGRVTFDSASYVAQYATKKITGPLAAAHYSGLRPEFLLMSRRPGLGASWFRAYKDDVFPSDEVVVRGNSTRPPRYYDQLLDQDFDEAAALAEERFSGVRESPLARLKAARIQAAESLDKLVDVPHWPGLKVAESRNAWRLDVRNRVAGAKLRAKSRTLEGVEDEDIRSL